MRALPLVASVLLASGCGRDNAISDFDTPPTVSITAPADGTFHLPGSLIQFVGLVDDDSGPETVEVEWSSSVDGVISDVLSPDVGGTVNFSTANLAGGPHAISLTAIDLDGQTDSSSIQITVGAEQEEGAPTVSLTGPAEFDSFVVGTEVFFTGTANDDETDAGALDCTLQSSVDGIFWEGWPESTGTINVGHTGLKPGVHNFTLGCVDEDGKAGTSSVNNVEIVNDGRPLVDITAPANNSTYWLGETVGLEGTTIDEEDDNITLAVEWRSSIDGVLTTGAPSSVGYTASPTDALSEGSHVITLSALDSDSKLGSDSIVVEVLDPGNVDQDGDGYTPNDGDCDDNNVNLSPDETELCDAFDNNCDGYINEVFGDIYEEDSGVWAPNNDADTAYNLGDVDGVLWGSNTVSLTGLTLHNDADEDWFYWNAKDSAPFDNVSIDVTVQFPTSGDYTAVLYLAGDSESDVSNFSGYQQVQSATGSGTLQFNYTGDQWDGDEDYWVIRVYSNQWQTGGCTTNYSLIVSS